MRHRDSELSGGNQTAFQMETEARLTEGSKKIPSTTISYKKVERGEVVLHYVPSKENVADILIKGVENILLTRTPSLFNMFAQ